LAPPKSLRMRIKRRLIGPAKAARRVAGTLAHVLDPTPLAAARLWAAGLPNHAAFICIYRSRNAAFVENLVAQASSLRMAVALWALDRPLANLSRWTIGSGSGLRLPLLNRLWESVGPSAVDQLAVSDDDFAFTRGDLSRFLRASGRCGFGIAQPAHDAASGWNHPLTRGRVFALARSTSFVEAGPLVVINGRWLREILPFPEELGMGWGLELLWQDLLGEGCRFGIVDAVLIRHVGLSRDYDVKAEKKRLSAFLKSRKIARLADVQRSLATWRPWQAEPPWRRAAARA
jgi:hypothetical protein